MDQKDIILHHLKEIEQEEDVKILLAVESGSRAWGFSSPDSDWDVRFLYIHRPEWYLSIREGRDVVERMYDDETDASGWDLKKALRLMGQSNSSLFEWLDSPIVYRRDDDFMEDFRDLAKLYFNPAKVLAKYRGLYINHNERYLQDNDFPLKRFLYYLRGVLACRWVEQFRTMPPVLFAELVDTLVDDSDIKERIAHILDLKSRSNEHNNMPVDPVLRDYANNIADYYAELDLTPLAMEYPGDEKSNRFFYDSVLKLL